MYAMSLVIPSVIALTGQDPNLWVVYPLPPLQFDYFKLKPTHQGPEFYITFLLIDSSKLLTKHRSPRCSLPEVLAKSGLAELFLRIFTLWKEVAYALWLA
jgi:hypothetical protein